MSHFVKELIQNEYSKRFAGMTEFVVISTLGINGTDNNLMRGELKKKGIHAAVVRNTLMRRALEKMGMANAASLFASGQCTVVYGGDGAGSVAKEVVDWAKKLKAIQLKGAYVEGTVMQGEAGVKALAAMPTRAELQGKVVQIALSPGSNVVGAILGGGSTIAGCLKSLIEKREKEAA
jgi:large subunit ribosomal protein L10